MPTEIDLPHDWAPRPYQRRLWSYLEKGGKRAVVAAHRRWGKDDVAMHFTATAAHKRKGTYWHMLPEAAQARKAVWEAINPHTGLRRIDEAFPRELREVTRENEMFIQAQVPPGRHRDSGVVGDVGDSPFPFGQIQFSNIESSHHGSIEAALPLLPEQRPSLVLAVLSDILGQFLGEALVGYGAGVADG